jgi:DNA/RNA-binding domain of Phe-tRNA-synthetase-like protein
MSFRVAEDCIRLGLRAGAVALRNVRVAPSGPDLLAEIAGAVETVRVVLPDSVAVRSVPEVVAFHEILRKVGVNPRRDQPSVERLLNFALKRGTLPAINSLVDAYNLVSIRSFCSLGAHDLDRIALPVSLRLLNGTETFTPLGSTTEVVVKPGEYGYVDAHGRVLCRLDVVQAEFSKVTSDTVNALLIVEGTAGHRPEMLHKAVAEAMELILRHCGGTAEVLARPDAASAM